MKSTKRNNRWAINDKVFRDNFIVLALIELTFVGASLIDGIIVSRFLEKDAMAAYGIAYPLFSIIAISTGLFATGMMTVTSQELGKGNVENCNRLFFSAFYIACIFSITFALIIVLCSYPLAGLLGAAKSGENMLRCSSDYIKGLGIGAPAIMLTGIVSPAVQMDSGRKRVLVSTILDVILSIVFDFVAVFLGWGMFGIGLATALSRYIHLAVLLFHFAGKSHIFHLVPLKIGFREFIHMLSLGTEKAIRRLGNVIRPVIVNRLVLYYGQTLAMTAMSVRGSVCEFTEIVAVGLADTVGLLTGIYFGERNEEAIHRMGKTVHRYCIVLCGMILILLVVFAFPLATFYSKKNVEAIPYTQFALIGVAIQCPLQALVRSRIVYLQRVEKTVTMQVLILISSLLMPVAVAFLLGKFFGAYGVLLCYTVSDFMTLVVIWIYNAFLHRKIIPTSKDYLVLPEQFEPNPGDLISFDLQSMEDISLASEQIGLFCKGHQLENDIANRASVCFEEVAENVIRFGFPMNKSKEPIMDLRVFFMENKLVVRIQDNCPKFDIAARMSTFSKAERNESLSGLGMLLINELADEVKYAYSFETNTVFLEFNREQKTQSVIEN